MSWYDRLRALSAMLSTPYVWHALVARFEMNSYRGYSRTSTSQLTLPCRDHVGFERDDVRDVVQQRRRGFDSFLKFGEFLV